jgi:hypothetical protein
MGREGYLKLDGAFVIQGGSLGYTQRGHKLRFFKGGKAQFVPCGMI